MALLRKARSSDVDDVPAGHRARGARRRAASGATLGAIFWIAVMWIATVRSFDLVSFLLLAVFGTGYSFASIWFLQRKHQRMARRQGAA